jgi:hypothetical protein
MEDMGSASDAAARFWSTPDWPGENYISMLKRFHETFKPKSYLEVGVATGATLALAECPSIAIDPNFRINSAVMNNKPQCHFYKMQSDRFFAEHDPRAILGRPLDMAFLDGFHWFEFLLRDFINVERCAKPNSIIFMHDCMPVDAFVARREGQDYTLKSKSAQPDHWAGDVWKAAAILRKYRPDLRMTAFDAKPTGLIAVTRLDPQSTLLADRYFDLVAEYADKELADEREAYFQAINVVGTRTHAAHQALSARFWL